LVSDETRPDADGESDRFLQRVTRLAIAIAVVGPAVAASLLAAWVFDEGSPNLDDLDYRNQAAALAQGHLTLSTSHLPLFAPYLTGVFDGRVVFSHQPVWPAVMAVGRILHVPNPLLLAMTTAAAIAAFAFLVHELTGSSRITAASALMLGFSPIVVVQGATLLPYTLQFALMCAGAAWVLRAQRTPSRRAGIGGGLALGLAIFN
jgi:hypothetical protein